MTDDLEEVARQPSAYSDWYDDGFAGGKAVGAAEERARIVAWYRAKVAEMTHSLHWGAVGLGILRDMADDIEAQPKVEFEDVQEAPAREEEETTP